VNPELLNEPIPRARRLLVLALALASAPGVPGPLEPPERIEVAPGIHAFLTPPYGDFGFDGNSVAIVSKEGVLVFDTNGTPAAAEAVLSEIRKLTDQPVKYLVNSHWHWDHWYGTEVYRRELRARISRDDPKTNQQFDLYLVSWYLQRVYDELAGPLTSAIAPPPG